MSQFSMSEAHRKALRKNRMLLVRDLILNEDFFSCIMENRIITEEMRESIQSVRHQTKKERAAALLDILSRRGPQAFEEFIRACVFSDQENLAFALDAKMAAVYHAQLEELMNSQPAAPPIARPPPNIAPPANKVMPSSQTPAAGYTPPQINKPATTGSMTEIPKEMVENSIMKIPMIPINPNDPNIQKEQLNEVISYKMSQAKRGRVLIINNEYFVDPNFSNREGSQYDTLNICELFKNLHFETILKENVTAKGMKKLLVDEARMQFNSEAFVLFIMSHGAQGRVYGNDGKYLDIEQDIVPVFDGKNCPDLINKPKIFFIQACQGDLKSAGLSSDNVDAARGDRYEMNTCHDIEAKEVTEALEKLKIGDSKDSTPSFDRTVHERADMVLAYSTLPGYLAFRNSAFGSFFVRAIVYIFSNYSHQCHIMDLLLYVRQLMNNVRTTDLEEKFMQVTTTSDRLMKKLYFCPGYTVTSM